MTDEAPIDPVTGKPQAMVWNVGAPKGMFRVVGWRVGPDGRYQTWIEDDFAERARAVARADAMKEAGAYSASVYNDRKRCVYTASNRPIDMMFPSSVTRLSGQKDPMKRVGTYRRK